ncbi:hypothetical protein THAOC_05301, partial [Thalassiosira oceanica]
MVRQSSTLFPPSFRFPPLSRSPVLCSRALASYLSQAAVEKHHEHGWPPHLPSQHPIVQPHFLSDPAARHTQNPTRFYNPAAPAANFTRCTLLESNCQGSQSLPPPTPSVPLMPYERPIRRTLHDPAVPSVNQDADDRSKLHADAALSALAKSKRSMKKKERPRNTRRQHSNPNVMNASAGREPTRFGRHLQKLKLQALPPCSDHNDDATTAAQYHRRRRRRASRSINLNPSGDHEDDHPSRPTYAQPRINHTPPPSDPFDPKAPQADPPQPGPSNLLARHRTFLFDDDELDKACEPGEPFDPKAPRAEPLQPNPSNLPARPPQIHHTVSFDDGELDKVCEPGEPFDPKAPRAEPLQPSLSNLPARLPERIHRTIPFDDDE